MARTYTDKQKAEALELYQAHGPAAASKKLGIPSPTIRKWAQRAGVTAARQNRLRANVETAHLTFAEQRAKLRVKLLMTADDLIERMHAPHQEFVGPFGTEVIYDVPPSKAVKDYSTSVGILIDKMRLELGEHTSHDRHESSAVDREIEKLLAEHDRRDPPKVNGNGHRNGHRSPA